MSDASNGQDNALPGLGIDWSRPAVWMRFLLASLLTGLTFGAAPPAIGLIIADWFQLAGKTLEYTTLLIGTVIVLGLAMAILRWMLNKGAVTRFFILSQSTWLEFFAAFSWSIVVAILAGLTGKMVFRLADPGHLETAGPVAMLGSTLVCIFCWMNSDLIVIWLRRIGRVSTAS